MLLTRTSAPATTPIDLDYCKAELRIGFSDDDTLIKNLIDAATAEVEARAGRALITQTLEMGFRCIGSDDELLLPRNPVQSLESISYYDATNTDQSMDVADFMLVKDDDFAVVQPVPGTYWPSAYDRADAIRVTFVAGFGAAADVPANLKKATALLVDHWFHRNETKDQPNELPRSVEDLIGLSKQGWFAA